MKVLQVLSIFLICNLGVVWSVSVGKFVKSYASAPNNEVRKMIVEDMLGDVNRRSIKDIFENYDETEEYEFDQILKNRDFLRKEDREHIDNMLKYTKVASSKWGQILLHPEKIPNPASFLQWDMKKLIKQAFRHPETRRWILTTVLQYLNDDKIQEKLKEKLGDKYQNASNYLDSLMKAANIKVNNSFRNTFHATDAETCQEAIDATWGYPLEILRQIIKLIGWHIVQVLVEANNESICSLADEDIGSLVVDFICESFDVLFCFIVEIGYSFLCEPLIDIFLQMEIEPLQQQPTLIPTIASMFLFYFQP